MAKGLVSSCTPELHDEDDASIKAWTEPSLSLLVKLGSVIIHVQEYLGPDGHPLDRMAFENVAKDPDVKAWLEEGTDLALLPVKRDDGKPGKGKP